MPTLVTGGTGLLGNNVIRALRERGASVRALVRQRCDPRPLEGIDVEVVRGDVRQADQVCRACEGIDEVVHAAGYVHIGRTRLEAARAINVEGTRHVVEAARQVGAKLVYVSSVNALAVGSRDEPADEESSLRTNDQCPYVVSKREAERLVLASVEEGLDAVIVHPGYMLGPWDWKPSSGRMMLEVARRFTPVAPIGGCSVCDVREVAVGILAALERGRRGRRYILAGENMAYFDLWKMFAEITGAKPPWMRAGPVMRIIGGGWGDLWTRLTGRESDVNSVAVAMSSQFHFYSSARAEAELGYRSGSARQAAQDAWQWLCQNGYL